VHSSIKSRLETPDKRSPPPYLEILYQITMLPGSIQLMDAQVTTVTAPVAEEPVVERSDKPIPLSFPALLRNPGINDRYGHLQARGPRPSRSAGGATGKRAWRDENEGKRWLRRKENATFSGNPHIALATKKDFAVQPPALRSTFPEPLPPYLPRNVKVPGVTQPIQDFNSSNAGRFSLSLKGMRRELRKAGYRAQALVEDIEQEMVSWLEAGGTLILPDTHSQAIQHPGRPVRSTGSIFEVSRTPLQLIWRTSGDSFARYVVHCCARYHNIVSYSESCCR
jgi:hypothetical protein